MTETDAMPDVAALTVQLLSAYLSNNTVASDDLAALIRTTRAALTEDAAEPAAPEAETFQPAVSPRKSLASSSHIISLIDGKPYKTLKRHLAANGLTPDTYRSRYNLPATYPMVAPDYAAHRRAVAQKIGLGSRKAPAEAVEEQELPDLEPATEEVTQEPEAKAAPKRGGKSAAAKKDAAPAAEAPQSDTNDADEPEAQVEEVKAPSSPKRKPRASKAKVSGTDQSAQADNSSAEQAQPAPKRSRSKSASEGDSSSAKPKKPQRMARQAKADASGNE